MHTRRMWGTRIATIMSTSTCIYIRDVGGKWGFCKNGQVGGRRTGVNPAPHIPRILLITGNTFLTGGTRPAGSRMPGGIPGDRRPRARLLALVELAPSAWARHPLRRRAILCAGDS